MAYVLKYYDEYYSNRNKHWRVEIHENGYSGSSEQISLGPERVKFTREAQGDSINKCIKGSECVIQIDSNSTLKYYSLLDYTPLKFLIKVFREGFLYWQGYVNGETYQEPYSNVGFYVTLCAYDGLTLLKNIKYLDSSGNMFTGKVSLLVLLQRALLNLTPTLSFISMVDLYETHMNNAYTDEPLAQSFIDNQRLYAKFPDCNYEDILTIVTDKFGQLRQHMGTWQLVPVRKMSSMLYGRRTWNLSTLTMTNSETNVDVSVSFTNTEANDDSRLCFIPNPNLETIPPLKKLIVNSDNGLNENAWLANDILRRPWNSYNNVLRWNKNVPNVLFVNGIPNSLTPIEADFRASFSVPITADDKKIIAKFTTQYLVYSPAGSPINEEIWYRFYIKTSEGKYYWLRNGKWWTSYTLNDFEDESYSNKLITKNGEHNSFTALPPVLKVSTWSNSEPPPFTYKTLSDSGNQRDADFEIDETADDVIESGEFIIEIQSTHHSILNSVKLKDFELTIDGYGNEVIDEYEYDPLGFEEENVVLSVTDLTATAEHPNDAMFSSVFLELSDGTPTKAWRRMPGLAALSLRQWLAQDYESIRGFKSIVSISGQFSGFIPWVGVVKDNIDLNNVYLPNAINSEDTGEDIVDVELIQIANYKKANENTSILQENGTSILLEDDSGNILLETEGEEIDDPNSHFEHILDTEDTIISVAKYSDVIFYAKANNGKIYYIDSNENEAELLTIYDGTIKQIYGNNGTFPKLVILTTTNIIYTYDNTNGLQQIETNNISSIFVAFALTDGAVYFMDSVSFRLWKSLNGVVTDLGIKCWYPANYNIYSPLITEFTSGSALIRISGNYIFKAFYAGELYFSQLEKPSNVNSICAVGVFYEWISPYYYARTIYQDVTNLNVYRENNVKVDFNTTSIGRGFATCKFGNYSFISFMDYFDARSGSSRSGVVYLHDGVSWHILNKKWAIANQPNASIYNTGVNIIANSVGCYRFNQRNIWKFRKEFYESQ